MESLEDPDSC
jgi:hypothetical protein